MSTREFIIVSRHPAAVAWVREKLGEMVADARVLPQATEGDLRGHIVIGNVPLALCSVAHEVWAIEFDGTPPRGTEYSKEEMDAAGAHLAAYRVTPLKT